MLNYKNIIDRLSEAQKINILTNLRCLDSEEYAKLGIPAFRLSHIEGYKQNFYQTPKSIANSWNTRIISELATDMVGSMLADGINTAVVSSPVAKLNITDFATSEDPFLSAKVSAEYISSMGRRGIGVILDGAYLDESDVSRLDKKPNDRLLNEFIIRPIRQALENKKCNGITVGSDIDVKNYETINDVISKRITMGEGKSFQNSYIICKNIAPEDTVSRIVKGHICLDGSDIVLKAAIDRYKRLKNNIPVGKTSICELNAEIENGNAFPLDKLDEAVDRVLGFVFDCANGSRANYSYTPNVNVLKNAACESTVLLKNENNILPLASGSVVAFVGDILVNYNGDDVDNSVKANDLAYYIRNQGCGASGFFRGYSMAEDISDNLLREIETSLGNVSTVLLFMGTNPQKESQMIRTQNLCLPANQLALLDRIHRMGKKIIAVVSSDLSFDVTFDRYVDALIVAPLNTRYGAEAVVDIITGRLSPMGKLASTLYRDTELVDRKQRKYINLPNSKVGTFIGYRYYDSADFYPAYPFGFGLGYTSFQYSNLSIQGRDVTFVVKNKGKTMGTEVAQLYIGLNNSKRCRPKKQLIGFEKITLQPGAAVTVRIPLDNIESFDEIRKEWLVEQGEYTVYVASSVRDVQLSGKILLGNVVLEDIDDYASDYLQSETNIISDRYTLEADYKLMKKNARNIVFGTGSLCLSVAMFLFSLITKSVGIFFIAVAAILAVAGLVFFVLEGSDRSKLHKAEREKINEANKASFADAQEIAKFSTAEVFAEEFDKSFGDAQKARSSVQTTSDNYLDHVNETLTFSSASEQFIAFASSRGYRFEKNAVDEIFAAMASSRLIITKGMTNDSFACVIKVLSEYFGTVSAVDVVDYSYVNDSSALYKTMGVTKQKTALANVIERSSMAKEKVHIAALTEVTFAEMSNYFVPFSRYIRNPRNAMVIEAIGEGGNTVTFKPAENLWFFVNLRMGERFKNMPSYISELASVIKIEYSGAVPTILTVPTAQFSYYQFDFMLDKIKADNGISEDTWKKIDSLETFVKGNVPYVLSNRVCIGIEKFYSVFGACGGEKNDALDRALSARVIPSAIVALDGIEDSENKNLTEKLEMIFGEDNIEISRSTVRASGSSVL